MANEIYTTGVIAVGPGERAYFNPGAGREMTVHNITVNQAATLEVYDVQQDESLRADVITEADGGTWMGVFLHCTENCHYAVWNNSGDYMTVNANGRYSK